MLLSQVVEQNVPENNLLDLDDDVPNAVEPVPDPQSEITSAKQETAEHSEPVIEVVEKTPATITAVNKKAKNKKASEKQPDEQKPNEKAAKKVPLEMQLVGKDSTNEAPVPQPQAGVVIQSMKLPEGTPIETILKQAEEEAKALEEGAVLSEVGTAVPQQHPLLTVCTLRPTRTQAPHAPYAP